MRTYRCSGHHYMSVRGGGLSGRGVYLEGALPNQPWVCLGEEVCPTPFPLYEQTDASENFTFPCGLVKIDDNSYSLYLR